MIKNKRGAEMTIGTIIIIILALVVLVFLIVGFSMGWKNLWSSITGYGGGEENVDQVAQTCKIACTANQKYNFCTKENKIIGYKGDSGNDFTCEKLSDGTTMVNIGKDHTTDPTHKKVGTSLGFEACPGLC